MKALYLSLILLSLFLFSCKKDKIQAGNSNTNGVTPVTPIPLPDSTLFIGAELGDSTVVNAFDSKNGSLVATYFYKHNVPSDWCLPLIGNGYLYVAEQTVFKALNIKTGEVMWTDSLKSNRSFQPVLHGDTFYGIYQGSVNSGSGFTVYALDATKQSDNFLWRYPIIDPSPRYYDFSGIVYYNGLIYIPKSNSLIALDAKTGSVMFTINSACSLSSLSNGILIFGNSLFDAATGVRISTVPPSLLVSNTNQFSSLEYATKNLFFTRVISSVLANNDYSSTSVLNAYDAQTNSLKWSINGGNNKYLRDTSKTVDQIYGNQVITRTTIEGSAGKYGSFFNFVYSGNDIITGQVKWSYNAGYDGQSFTVNNLHFNNGTLPLNFGYGTTSATTVVADINTGKIRWTKNQQLNYLTHNGICLYTAGKGYSAYIQ